MSAQACPTANFSRHYGLGVLLHVVSSRLAMRYLCCPEPARHSCSAPGRADPASSLPQALCTPCAWLPHLELGRGGGLTVHFGPSFPHTARAGKPSPRLEFLGPVARNIDGDFPCPRISIKGQIWEGKQTKQTSKQKRKKLRSGPVILGRAGPRQASWTVIAHSSPGKRTPAGKWN